jgi:hypothetical protein
MGTTLMLVSRRRSGFSETDRLLPGETGDDMDIRRRMCRLIAATN